MKPLKCDVDLPPAERSLYYQILDKEYYELRSMLIGYWSTKSKEEFSEDVFHDTLINCINACCVMDSRIDVYRYVCKSFYLNMLRERKYGYRLYNTKLQIWHDRYADESFDNYRRQVYEVVKKEKGERVANVIHDYVDGYTFDELIAKYNIKNIHNKASKLKKYMKNLLIHWNE